MSKKISRKELEKFAEEVFEKDSVAGGIIKANGIPPPSGVTPEH